MSLALREKLDASLHQIVVFKGPIALQYLSELSLKTYIDLGFSGSIELLRRRERVSGVVSLAYHHYEIHVHGSWPGCSCVTLLADRRMAMCG